MRESTPTHPNPCIGLIQHSSHLEWPHYHARVLNHRIVLSSSRRRSRCECQSFGPCPRDMRVGPVYCVSIRAYVREEGTNMPIGCFLRGSNTGSLLSFVWIGCDFQSLHTPSLLVAWPDQDLKLGIRMSPTNPTGMLCPQEPQQ
jgi:hypothetical protein